MVCCLDLMQYMQSIMMSMYAAFILVALAVCVSSCDIILSIEDVLNHVYKYMHLISILYTGFPHIG